MKAIAILDTETTGLDPKKDCAIEVAVCVWSVKHRTVLETCSCLIGAPANPAEHVNRIPAAALVDAASEPWVRVSTVLGDIEGEWYFVAHRAEFDRSFVPKDVADTRPWICSKFDIEWPRSAPGASLVEVALAHDVAVAYNHRALADVMLLARIFERVAELGHDVEAMLRRGLRPKAKFCVAETGYDPKRNEIAKANGFRWEPDPVKLWTRTMAIEDVASLPFETRQVRP